MAYTLRRLLTIFAFIILLYLSLTQFLYHKLGWEEEVLAQLKNAEEKAARVEEKFSDLAFSVKLAEQSAKAAQEKALKAEQRAEDAEKRSALIAEKFLELEQQHSKSPPSDQPSSLVADTSKKVQQQLANEIGNVEKEQARLAELKKQEAIKERQLEQEREISVKEELSRKAEVKQDTNINVAKKSVTPPGMAPSRELTQPEIAVQAFMKKRLANTTVDPEIACTMPTFDFYEYDKTFIRQSRLLGCGKRVSEYPTLENPKQLQLNCNGKPEVKFHSGTAWSDWISFDESTSTVNATNSEVIAVKCDDAFDYTIKAKRNDEAVKRAISKMQEMKLSSGDLINVITIGFDSLSRAQFYRKLRKTSALIHSSNLNYKVFEFEYYNVLGDGTLKCLVPLLVGYDAEDQKHIYNGWKNGGKKLDDWPWIWRTAKEYGYVTLYGEDFCPGVFSLNLAGFTNKPTDHSMSNLFCSGLPTPKRQRDSHGTCIGSRHAHVHHFDFIRTFMHAYEGMGRISYSHLLVGHEESLGEIEVADQDLRDMIAYMDEHFSDNTIFMIIGDHGPRYGGYRQTLNGKLEERLPTFFMFVPPALESKHPEIFEALTINQKRLVTAFDIHQTLEHVIVLFNQNKTKEEYVRKDNPGISLFTPVPKDRTCSDARIELHWCACMGWYDVPANDTKVQKLAQVVLDKINSASGDGNGPCALLKLGRIDSSQLQNLGEKVRTYNIKSKTAAERWNMDTKLSGMNYRIQFVAQPGDAVYEGIVLVTNDGKEEIKQISRISKYSHQQTCKVPPGVKSSYCVCKNWLEGARDHEANLIFEQNEESSERN